MKENRYGDTEEKASRVAYLIAGFIRQTLTEKEHDELDDWVNESDHNMQLFEELTDEKNLAANLEWMDKLQTEQSYQALQERNGMNELFSKYGEEAAMRVSALMAKYVKGTLTEEEHTELDEWVIADDENMEVFARLTTPKRLDENIAWMNEIDTEAALARAKKQINLKGTKNPSVIRMLSYAAAVAIVFVAGMLTMRFYQSKNDKQGIVMRADLEPGTDKAQVRLGDGKIVVLGDTVAGLTIAPGVHINKAEGGLIYEASAGTNDTSKHLLSVPKGGMYRVQLGDGTKVWVNAGSSIEYPAQFGKGERNVILQGEAYFEVAKDAARPFIVSQGENSIRVLGTKFNVNGYGDVSPNITTVTEGRVALQKGGNAIVLTANEAGTVLADGKLAKQRVEDDEATAWTAGKFVLKDAGITEVMSQVERWYDASIVYEAKPGDHFNLELKRDEKVSKVLQLLEMTGRVHFEIKGKVITVKR